MKRFFIFWIAMFSYLFCHSQQNTILIIADDVSPDYFGAFSTTTDTAATPNISTLAASGVKFAKVWSSPVCSPTRAGILTGRYSFRTGVGQVISSATSPQLDTNEISLATLLRDSATIKFNTACVGKWHLHAATPGQLFYPNRMGFNFYSGNFNGALNNYYNYPMVVNGTWDSSSVYATTQTVNDAIGWLDTIDTARPFFMWVAFNSPHTPFHIPPSTLCDVTGLTGTTQHINTHPELYFKAAIQAMDSEIGRLLAYLDANNLRDSTNIIFIGDNGNVTQVAQIANQAHSKGTCYDYGVRVPLFVTGPVVVNAGRTSDALVNTTDLFATIAEICIGNTWSQFVPATTSVDAKSFLSVLKDLSINNRDWIFSEQFNQPPIAEDGKTIRNADFHLIRKDIGTEEFYNQSIDPEESINLLTGTLSPLELYNYSLLCDSLSALTGLSGCVPLGFVDESLNNSMVCYPNPATDVLNINSAGLIEQVNLYDLTGRYISTFNSKEIDVSNLPEGNYLLKIKLISGTQRVNRLVVLR